MLTSGLGASPARDSQPRNPDLKTSVENCAASGRGYGNAIHVTALTTKDDVERRKNKLFSPRGADSALFGNDVIASGNGTLWALGLRLGFGDEIRRRRNFFILVAHRPA